MIYNQPIRRMLSGDVDFTMMYAAHDAFTRHLLRMINHLDGRAGVPSKVVEQWHEFSRQLHTHHTGEDIALWPALRAAVPADDEPTLDAMEAEHAALDPLLTRIDTHVESDDALGAAAGIRQLADVLGTHMRHEENEALPLVESHLGPAGWAAFGLHMRDAIGLKGAQVYFPWLLDGADGATTERVLGQLPMPARILYRRSWLPKYRRSELAT
jgi:hemerythrin-like domain-containing protein